MRTLDPTVSIGLLTGKTPLVRPSVTLKRYSRRLVPTKVYYRDKLRYHVDSTICQLCKEQPETVAHILEGCPALAQKHYTAWHNAVLKCLYFTLLKQVRSQERPSEISCGTYLPTLLSAESKPYQIRVTGRMSQCSTNKHKKSW